MMKNLSLFTKNLQEKSRDKISDELKRVFSSRFLERVKRSKITKPYQFFGVWIAKNLEDYDNIPLYIHLAKNQDRALLERAISYVKDYPNARSKQKLFLWFLKGKLKKTINKRNQSKEKEIPLFKNSKISQNKQKTRKIN